MLYEFGKSFTSVPESTTHAYLAQILQVLVFCIPFYDFLDQVGKRAAHTFKSDTPLLDAMYVYYNKKSKSSLT